ncbi:hypothetical protein AMAG_09680 [Allomyces macrogynus ATCC 38327]|uniref:Aspartyl/Glutamyl-tRNA(Gln) amidotransferase subunit B/E catalytic domain-containing protein n=1 Tax=Allomyces macrogynus (strain ATCC 38327) TaxID=578462 RepID=A0A0L0SSY6_ALLM3|nr:hypothetical protein AMAG_09680 [Allomyces macrogynus ATCC 38327]|eukprot:KNE65698.1 hypothetical protein AMAG_09680 [Allomyces macrogynus ATCC 38327]
MAPVANLRVRPVIGLEFHAQIASRVKLFSPMTTNYFGQPPNCAVAQFDLALPGAMPVLNREPVVLALATALALDCTIPPVSRFERKHYLYPDLRARSPQEAAALVKALQAILRTLGSCDANLEEGSLRVDVNVSVAADEAQMSSERVEIKNIATVSGLVAALEFEITRQTALLATGTRGSRETRGFDPATQQTFPLRAKESARDYRFAADADLPPLHIRPTEIDAVRAALPPLPAARHEALATQFPSLTHDQLQWLLDGCPLLDSAAIADEQSRARSRYARALQGVESQEVEGEVEWTNRCVGEGAMAASPRKPGLKVDKYATWVVGQVLARSKGRADPQVAQAVVAGLVAEGSA